MFQHATVLNMVTSPCISAMGGVPSSLLLADQKPLRLGKVQPQVCREISWMDLLETGLLFWPLIHHSLRSGNAQPGAMWCGRNEATHGKVQAHSRCSLSAHSFRSSQPRSWGHLSPTYSLSQLPPTPTQAPILTSEPCRQLDSQANPTVHVS